MEIAGQDAELPEIRRRIRIFGLLVPLAFLALLGRLFYLQIVEGDSFYKLTTDSIVRTVRLPAVRGRIRDRKGRVLASMRPAYNVMVTPRQLTAEGFARLAVALSLSPEASAEAWDRVSREKVKQSADKIDRPLVLAEDVNREAMAVIETSLDIPGVRIEAEPRRHYPMGSLASHLLGFMNEISADELKTRKDEGYRSGQVVGRSGVERQWEAYLRGHEGFEKVVVDSRGLRKADVAAGDLIEGPLRAEPAPGNDVVLTIDADVQRITERALRNHHAGAAVVLDVDTGRILAIASKPAPDPNVLSGRMTPEVEMRLLSDRFRPLRDRTVQETYNPGSTFKAVATVTALEDHLVTPEDRQKCKGFVQIGRRRFRCSKSHGVVNLHQAIVQSCNVYFYELGKRDGVMDRFAHYAADLGLGAPTGLGLNSEEGGFLPTVGWFNEQKKNNPKAEGFVQGHALNTAIGEGSTRVTPLQMALLYSTVANGGRLWLPQIVDHIEAPDGRVLEEFAPRLRREVSVSAEHLQTLREALVGVVNEPRGTAYKARTREIEIAGKTGTAQVLKVARKGDAPLLPYEQNDHAWFAGFAPAGRPRIAFAVIVEHGGHGGDVAAPVAVEIVRRYFDEVAPGDREAPRIGRRLAAAPADWSD